jgi:hypothetical protein
MPIVDGPDGTLWIDICEMTDVDAVGTSLRELGVRATALVCDPSCDVILPELDWAEEYPKVVPRNGPEPGIVVNPSAIPDDRTLVLEARTLRSPGRDDETVILLHLVAGSIPGRVGKFISSRPVPPHQPGWHLPKPPPAVDPAAPTVPRASLADEFGLGAWSERHRGRTRDAC